MALNQQQLEAIQQEIEDTRPVSERVDEQMEGLKSLGTFVKDTAIESTPVVGEALIAKDISEDVSEGDYLSAGLNTAALGVGALPIVGDVLNKPLRAAAKKFRKADTVDETVDTMTAAGLTDADIKAWRRPKEEGGNATSEDFRKSLKGRNPILIDLANARKANEITAKEYREAADAFRPIRTVQDVPEPATTTELVSALGKKSEKGVVGVNRNIPDGDRITARLDINAYTDYDVWIPTLTHPDKKTMYSPTVVLRDVSFIQPDDKAVDMALNVATGKSKAPFAVMEGNYQSISNSDAFEYAKEVFDDKNWTQVGYDPTRRGFFYDRKTGEPILNAEEVVQVGHLVLAKNAVKGNADDFRFNEGGVVPMKKQMEMFEDGGLMQEGGTTDPVSGNDVPVGSTQEEVRDDIPAQLSEGEFVFPADVVRFYGLEKLMKMRQRAKAGLQMMEDMGQMGNSEEATLPDDIPFDLEDLDMEDGPEYNDTMEMQVGGFVQPQGFTGIQTMQPSVFQNYQPQYVPYQAPTIPTTYQPPQQQTVPTFTGQVPKVEDFLKTPQPGEQDLRKYVNAEGQVRMIPFVNDQPIYPIPQGFYPETEKPVEEEAPTAVTTETAKVVDRGGRDNDVSKYGGATISLGGQSKDGLIQGGTTYGLMFDDFTMGALTNMGLMGLGKTLLGKEPMSLPEGTSATIVDKQTGSKVSIPSSVYNEIRNNLTGTTAKEVSNIIEKINDFKSVGATNEDLNDAWATEQAKNLANKLSVKEAQKTGKWDAVIENAIKEAEAMVAADDDEDLGTAPTTTPSDSGKDFASNLAGLDFSRDKSRDTGRDDAGKDSGSSSSGKGDSSGIGGCFAKGTMFKMADGTTKAIEDIKYGDKMYKGGLVYAIMQGDGTLEDWYNYNNVHVTSGHPVYDKGVWKRVGNTDNKVSIDNYDVYYSLMNTNHLMVAENGTIFTDFVEIGADVGDRGNWMMQMLNEREAEATAA